MRKSFEMDRFENHILTEAGKENYRRVVEYFRNNRYWECNFVNDFELHLMFTGACLTPEYLIELRKDLNLKSIWVTYAPAWDYKGIIVCGEFNL